MISIGVDFMGPEHPETAIGQLLLAASRRVQEHRGDYESYPGPRVNVVFYVPGSLGDFPNITKVAAGRFSRKQKLLLVEVPVPRDVAESGGSVEFVISALRQANAIAADVFARKGPEPFDLAKAEAIVKRVKEALVAQPR
jgi:hypothetical protein